MPVNVSASSAIVTPEAFRCPCLKTYRNSPKHRSTGKLRSALVRNQRVHRQFLGLPMNRQLESICQQLLNQLPLQLAALFRAKLLHYCCALILITRYHD
jgi:hypothetical protein